MIFASEEKPSHMALWITLLVVTLHFKIFLWLTHTAHEHPGKPLLPVEVTLLAVPLKQAEVEPEKPKPIIKFAPSPLPKPKAKPKPVSKPKKPVPVQAANTMVSSVPVVKTVSPEPSPVAVAPVESTQAVNAHQASANTQVPIHATTAPSSNSASDAYVEASYRANYSYNPKPRYPNLARSRHLEGKVLLRVKVTAEGLSEEVTIDESSGYEILDDSAVEAVQNWKFTPARRGNKSVACTVTIPIVFKLSQ